MKKLLLIASLMAVALSGCYVVPNRGQDDGYRNGQDRHGDGHDRNDRRDRDSRDDGHSIYR